MVDIETTGTDPSHSHIIQISAVRFNIETQEIDTSEMFDRCLHQDVANRFWDDSTRQWWSEQKAEVYQKIMDRSENPEAVMVAFQDFLIRTTNSKPVMFWSKPLSFDWPFLASYLKQFGRGFPLHYRYAKDVNTYIWAKGHTDVDAYWKSLGFVGNKHDAIYDVINQIRGVMLAGTSVGADAAAEADTPTVS